MKSYVQNRNGISQHQKAGAKAIAFLMACILAGVFGFCGRAAAAQGDEPDLFYTQGLEVISLMSEMLKSEYTDVFFESSDDIVAVVENIRDDDFSSPKAVYSIALTDAGLEQVELLNLLDHFSDGLQTFLMQKVLASTVTRINMMGGPAYVAAANIYTAEKLFVAENPGQNRLYLYTYDNAAPVAVIFSIGDDNAVSANGSFILYDEFSCGSIEEVKDFFSYLPADVTEVEI